GNAIDACSAEVGELRVHFPAYSGYGGNNIVYLKVTCNAFTYSVHGNYVAGIIFIEVVETARSARGERGYPGIQGITCPVNIRFYRVPVFAGIGGNGVAVPVVDGYER